MGSYCRGSSRALPTVPSQTSGDIQQSPSCQQESGQEASGAKTVQWPSLLLGWVGKKEWCLAEWRHQRILPFPLSYIIDYRSLSISVVVVEPYAMTEESYTSVSLNGLKCHLMLHLGTKQRKQSCPFTKCTNGHHAKNSQCSVDGFVGIEFPQLVDMESPHFSQETRCRNSIPTKPSKLSFCYSIVTDCALA